ncbi:MAG: hypothetical protein ACREEM_19705 [Blastocatellia bacterium]
MKNTPTNAGFAAVVLSLIFLDIASHNTRSAQTGPVNPNFEEGTIGQPPVGWSVPSLASQSGYSAVLTDEQPKSGSRCAVIIREGPATGRGFGNLTQSLDAAPYRGKRIRFRSAVRVEVVGFGNQAQLWMRADRLARGGNQTTGFFDNMDDRPINSREWAYYEIVGDIESDADKINIGLMLMGAGKAWLDDVTLEIVGEAEKRIEEPARPLAARGLENMTAFTRLLGYVRHFHPSDEAARTDWEVFTIEGMRAVESAKDSAELAQKLETLFRSVAPTIRVFPSSQPLKESQARPPTSVVWV